MNKIMAFIDSCMWHQLLSLIFALTALVNFIMGEVTHGLLFLLLAKGEDIHCRLKEW